jgi:hypothetical protein
VFVCVMGVNQCIGAYQVWWCLCAIGVGSYQVWAVAGGFVRHHGGGLAGEGGRVLAAYVQMRASIGRPLHSGSPVVWSDVFLQESHSTAEFSNQSMCPKARRLTLAAPCMIDSAIGVSLCALTVVSRF